MKTSNNTAAHYRLTAIFLLLLIGFGRAVSCFCSVSAVDVGYAEWVSSLLGYLSETLSAARSVVGFAAMAYAAYRFGERPLFRTTLLAAAGAFLDGAVRFLIDFFSGTLLGTQLVAVIWLALQFLYETLFLFAGSWILRRTAAAHALAETQRRRKQTDRAHAAHAAVLLVLASRILLEAWYLVDFLLAYTGITNAEIASIVGQFLKILVIYGGISLLLTDAFLALWDRMIGRDRSAR